MTSLQSFSNSARLALANINLAGNKLEEMIAALNPDAAIAVGRDEREAQLKVVALKLAEQRQHQGRLEAVLAATATSLANQKKAAKIVLERAQDQTQAQPSQKAKQQLADAIGRLKQEVERTESELAGVKTAVEFLDHMVDTRADALRSFDSEASTLRHRLDMAKLREGQASLEAEMQGLAKEGASTAGLGALGRAASKAEARAGAAEIVLGATSTNPGNDATMAAILAEAADGPKKSADDQLAALIA